MKRSVPVPVTVLVCAVLVALTTLCVCTALPLSRKHAHTTTTTTTHHVLQRRGGVRHQRSSSFTAGAAKAAARMRGFKCKEGDYPELPKEQLPLYQSAEFKTYGTDVIVIDGAAAYKANAEWQEAVKKDTAHLSPKGLYLKKWVDPMLDWAKRFVQPKFAALLHDFGLNEFGANRYVEVLVAPPKSLKSAIPKIGNDYGGDLTRLVDGVRGSLVYQTEADVKEGTCAFKAYLDNALIKSKYGCSVKTSKNRWDKPLDSGYRDFMMTIQCVITGGNAGEKSENPYNHNIVFYAEVQVHMCAHLMVKQATVKEINEAFKVGDKKFLWNGHEGYEEVRKSKFPVEWKGDEKRFADLQDLSFGEVVNVLAVPSADQKYGVKLETQNEIKKWYVKYGKYLTNEKILNQWAAAKPGLCDMSRVAEWVAAQHKVAVSEILTLPVPWHSKEMHTQPLVGGVKLEPVTWENAKKLHDKSRSDALQIKPAGVLSDPPTA